MRLLTATPWRLAAPLLIAYGMAILCCGPTTHIRPAHDSPVPPETFPRAPLVASGKKAPPPSAPASPQLRARTVDLGQAKRALSFRLLPVPGHKSALVIHEQSHPRTSFVRRLDTNGTLGPVRETPGRSIVGAVDLPAPTLITSDGRQLCFESLTDTAVKPRCHLARAHFVVPTPDAIVLLESRRPPKKKAETKKNTATKATAKKEARSPKPSRKKTPQAKKRQKKRSKKRRRRRRPPKPIPVDIVVTRYDARGERLGETSDSGLRIAQPLAGMGLTDAVPIESGIQLLWYAHVKPEKRGRRSIQRAALRVGQLDSLGRWRPSSLQTLFVGERRYGYIEGRGQARLLGHAGRALYLGRRRNARRRPMRPESWWLDPTLRIGMSETLYSVAPWRLTEPPPLRKTEQRVYEQLKKRLRGRRRPLEAGQVTWVGDRAWMVDGTKPDSTAGASLWSIDRNTGETSTLPTPFEASRSELRWVSLNPDGSALIANASRLRSLDDKGALHDAGQRPGLDPAARENAVRIGDEWWALTADVESPSLRSIRRVAPAGAPLRSLRAFAHRDACALVGGAKRGLFIALNSGRLRVWTLTSDGKTRSLGSFRSPVGRGFHAVQNSSGGAIVIGPSTASDGSWLSFAINSRGRLLPSYELAPKLEQRRVDLTPRPGGALVQLAGRALWLDDEARIEGRADIPSTKTSQPKTSAPCTASRRGRTQLAGSKPGQLVDLPPEVSKACWLAPPQWLDSGSLRIATSTHEGLDEHAKLVTLGPWPPHTSAPPPRAKAKQAPRTRLKRSRCPADMVDVGGRYCIDRFEARLFAGQPLQALSPFFSPSRRHSELAWSVWSTRRRRVGDLHARATLLPPRPQPHPKKTRARSLAGVLPSGYLTSYAAEKSCQAVGKRLCTHDEWTMACRGEKDTKFPYGEDYRHGVCNVFRYTHPAGVLHGNASIGHLDPRLHLVHDERGALLQPTGSLTQCVSRWGEDGIYDMVGNLDEWVDEKGGAFAGGFYARASRSGCESVIGVHPRRYFDYSLGTRCCRAVKR